MQSKYDINYYSISRINVRRHISSKQTANPWAAGVSSRSRSHNQAHVAAKTGARCCCCRNASRHGSRQPMSASRSPPTRPDDCSSSAAGTTAAYAPTSAYRAVPGAADRRADAVDRRARHAPPSGKRQGSIKKRAAYRRAPCHSEPKSRSSPHVRRFDDSRIGGDLSFHEGVKLSRIYRHRVDAQRRQFLARITGLQCL